jgi:hypothetical protein
MPRPDSRKPDQQAINDLITEAVERFLKNQCSNENCERAKETDLIKKMVFDPASVRRINCTVCEKYGIPIPREARGVLKHLLEKDRAESA